VNHDTETAQSPAKSVKSHVASALEQPHPENADRAASVRALNSTASSGGGPWSTQIGSRQMFKIGPSLVERIAYQNDASPMTGPKSRLLPLMCADSEGILWLIGGVSGKIR
jgi:hypothetical protein